MLRCTWVAKLMLLTCVGTVFFLLVGTGNADTLHVDSCADVPGEGSQSNPYRTLPMAVAEAALGDAIIVQSGSYPESLAIGNKLTIAASGGPVLVGAYHAASAEVCVPITDFFGRVLPQGSCPERHESPHVNAKLYYPSRDGREMACGGAFPAIVYAHGFRFPEWVLCDGAAPGEVHEDYRQAEGILRRLAAAGIIVISVDNSAADQQGLTSESGRTSIILNTIAYLRDENQTPDSFLKGVVNLSLLGLAGHSAGGRAAMLAARWLNDGLADELLDELNLGGVHVQALGLDCSCSDSGPDRAGFCARDPWYQRTS